MKRKEVKDLRNKSIEQLQKLLSKKKFEAMQIGVKLIVVKEKNLKRVKYLKKEVAQIKTIIREKELIKEDVKEEEKNR